MRVMKFILVCLALITLCFSIISCSKPAEMIVLNTTQEVLITTQNVTHTYTSDNVIAVAKKISPDCRLQVIVTDNSCK